MEDLLKDVFQVASEIHPRKSEKFIQYGTAGFRTRAIDLDHVMFRMGLLAVLRSKLKNASIGVMITASHNPEEDNGVKLVDPQGDMLEMAWEKHASHLANVSDSELCDALKQITETTGLDPKAPAKVILGRDTRPSSTSLAQAVTDGVKALQGDLQDYGVLTTPQLHYMVRCVNSNSAYGQPTEEGYYHKLAHAFHQLRQGKTENGNYRPSLFLDAANGVGAPKMKLMIPHIQKLLSVDMCNDGTKGKLNYMCGADYVKVQQKAPEGLHLESGVRGASFDGDADRLVYYYIDAGDRFCLLDGDKIATLVAGFLQELVTANGLKLNLGLVQTAYANGSSTDYITNKLKMPVACVPTGVKHLHHRAQQYDIGVYFEANGHGTVLFSDKALEQITHAAKSSSSEKQQNDASRLLAVVDLINQTVGDAISDLLLVETVLHTRGWNAQDWNSSYTDLPNRQLKVKVKDRTVIQTTDAERKTTSPPGLQEAIDAIVAKYPKGRSFVRPSGTEDVVRVYAESDTRANADQLAYEVSLKAFELAGGVGDPPKPL